MRPIVVSRCDRIGDLVLSLPALGLLGQAGFRRRVLHCSAYAADIGEWALHNGLCEDLWIAGSVPPRFLAEGPAAAIGLCLQLSRDSVNAFRELGLRDTLGPRTKLWSLWRLRHTIAQHRSCVKKSEMEYNLDLVRELLRQQKVQLPDFSGLPALKIPSQWQSSRSSPDLVAVVSNRGSAADWPLTKYLEFARMRRDAGQSVDLLVSGTDASQKLAELSKLGIEKEGIGIVKAFSRLRELIAYLGAAKEVLSSSTGPLHIAHAAGVAVSGIYPKKRVESFKRWCPDGYWHRAPLRLIEIDES